MPQCGTLELELEGLIMWYYLVVQFSFKVVIYTFLKQYRSDGWIKGCLLVDRLSAFLIDEWNNCIACIAEFAGRSIMA